MKLEWEYRVEELGGTLRSAKAQELETLLNELAEDGWELVTINTRGSSSGNQLLVVLRRQAGRRPRDRSRTWP